MLYAIVGDSVVNSKEVLASLNSLYDAAEASGADDPMWLLFHANPDASETMQDVVKWAVKKRLYFEVVLEEDAALPDLFTEAEETWHAKRVYDKLYRVMIGRINEGEGHALLLLDNELEDHENTTYYLADKCIENGIPVYDLANQMMRLVFDEPEFAPTDEDDIPARNTEPAAPEAAPVAADEAPEPSGDDDEPWATEESLKELSRDELKALCAARDVVPLDQRSKKSMIDALLGRRSPDDEQATPPEPDEALGIDAAARAYEDNKARVAAAVKEAEQEAVERVLGSQDDEEPKPPTVEEAKARIQNAVEQAVVPGPATPATLYFIESIAPDGTVTMTQITAEVAKAALLQ